MLQFGPGPRVVFSGEEDNGCDDVVVVGNEFAIEVRKTEERAYSFDRGWGMPILDGDQFRQIHANETLTNNHPQIFHGGGVEGAFGDLEGKTMFLKVREDSTSLLMM